MMMMKKGGKLATFLVLLDIKKENKKDVINGLVQCIQGGLFLFW